MFKFVVVKNPEISIYKDIKNEICVFLVVEPYNVADFSP